MADREIGNWALRATWLSLALYAGLAFSATWSQTATADEPIYAAAGLRVLETADPRTNEISSPWLLKTVLALPLFAVGERADLSDRRMFSDRLALHWHSSWDWLHSEGRSAMVRLRIARAMNVLLGVLVGWGIFVIGRRLVGPIAGWAGSFVWATWPEALAHGGLASLDMGVTLLGLWTLWAALPLFEGEGAAPDPGVGAGADGDVGRNGDAGANPTVPWWRVGVAGGLLGLCFLAKTSAVILGGFLFGAAVLSVFLRWWASRRCPLLGRWVVLFAVAFLTLHAGFGFDGSFRPLADNPRWPGIQQRMQALPGASEDFVLPILARLPSPLPDSYIELLAVQTGIGESGKQVFFHGERKEGGWPWFLVSAFVMKTPFVHLGLLAAGVLLLVAGWRRGWRHGGAWCALLGFAAFVFVFFVFTDRFGLLRYLLPVVPIFALVAGLPLAAAVQAWRERGQPSARLLGAGLVAALVASVAVVYPHHLSALQLLAGGKGKCHEWFADSNCDWGQDLARAAEVARRAGHREGAIAYFGSSRPREYFPGWTVLPSVGVAPEAGQPWWYDDGPMRPLTRLPELPLYISVSLLRGVQLPGVYAILDGREPDAMATPAIAVFLPPHPNGPRAKSAATDFARDL